MRISDWSSDVCSSDLFATPSRPHPRWPDTWQPIQFREYSWRAFLRRKPSLKSLCGQSDISFPWCFCVFEIPKIWYPGLFSKHLQHLLNNLHAGRSEEHTSELQSLMRISYAVFCLKKKHKHI